MAKTVDKTQYPKGFTPLSIHEYSYSTGEDDDGVIQTVDFGDTSSISAADGTTKEVAIAVHSEESIQWLKFWGKRKNFPGMTWYYGTAAALAVALEAAGTPSTLATTAMPGEREDAVDLTFAAGESHRIIMQVAITKASWVPFRDYDPSEDALSKFASIGFYGSTKEYEEWLDIAHGYEDVSFGELYDMEVNIIIDGYEIPMGHFQPGIEFVRDESRIEKKMLEPAVNTMIARSEVSYMLNGTLSVVDMKMYSIITGHDITYDSTNKQYIVTAKDNVRIGEYEMSVRGVDTANRLVEFKATRVVFGQNGNQTRHMQPTEFPITAFLLADYANDNEIYEMRRTSQEIFIAYIDCSMGVVTT